MTSVENEIQELPECFYIPEQDLRLINEIKPFYHKKDNLYVLVAREVEFRNGINKW